MSAPAVFLDRDGVLVEDRGLPVDAERVPIPEGVPAALRALHEAGYRLVVISNQAVVARGWATEDEVVAQGAVIEQRLRALGAPALDGVYFCPHHPDATLTQYRIACECRKPRPGLVLRAAAELGIDLGRSFFVGDRATDIAAGHAAGCRTVLMRSGQHDAPPIVTSDPFEDVAPDFACDSLGEAAAWIVGGAA